MNNGLIWSDDNLQKVLGRLEDLVPIPRETHIFLVVICLVLSLLQIGLPVT